MTYGLESHDIRNVYIGLLIILERVLQPFLSLNNIIHTPDMVLISGFHHTDLIQGLLHLQFIPGILSSRFNL